MFGRMEVLETMGLVKECIREVVACRRDISNAYSAISSIREQIGFDGRTVALSGVCHDFTNNSVINRLMSLDTEIQLIEKKLKIRKRKII